MRYRHASQRYFDIAQLDPRLRRGLIGWWIGQGSGQLLPDVSGYQNHGTLVAGPLWSLGVGWQRHAIAVDGVDDYVLSAKNVEITGDSPMTLAVWCWFSSVGGGWNKAVLAFGNTGVSGGGAGLFVGDTGRVTGAFYGGIGYAGQSAQGTVTTGVWYHIALTKLPGVIDATTTKIYVNGVQQSLAFSGANTPNIIARQAYLGSDEASEFANACIIDAACIYNRALNDSEIALLANPAFLPIRPSGRRPVNTTLLPTAMPWVPQMALMGIG